MAETTSAGNDSTLSLYATLMEINTNPEVFSAVYNILDTAF